MSLTVVAETGDGRTAIFERATNEPLQYCVHESSKEKLTQRWEEILSQKNEKAKR
jgi:hypothetical protein